MVKPEFSIYSEKEPMKSDLLAIRGQRTKPDNSKIVRLITRYFEIKRSLNYDHKATTSQLEAYMLEQVLGALEIRNIKPITEVVIRRLSAQNLKADNIQSLGSEGDIFIDWIEDNSKSAIKGEHILELMVILNHLLTVYKSEVKYFVVSFLGSSDRAFRGCLYQGRLGDFLERNSDKIVFPEYLTALQDAEKNARVLLKTAIGLVNIQEGNQKNQGKGTHTLESAKRCQKAGLSSILTFSKALMKPSEMLLAENGKTAPNLIDHHLDVDLIDEFKNRIDPSKALLQENEDLRDQLQAVTKLLEQVLSKQSQD